MLTLTSTNTTGQILTGGDKWVQVNLNGGSADLEVQVEGAGEYVSDGALEEGILVITLPKGYVRLTNVTGTPSVFIEA